MLLRLAHALGIPSAWLLVRLQSNDPPPPPRAQATGASTTPFLTLEKQAALLSLLGATLRQSRQQQHMTQTALAAKTGLVATYISQIEGGKRNVTLLNLIRLADALDLSVNHLFAVLDA